VAQRHGGERLYLLWRGRSWGRRQFRTLGYAL